MRSQSQAPAGNAEPWWDELANWLALAALLALGIVWPPADAGEPAPSARGTLWLKSAPDATPAAALRQQTRMHATVTGSVARVRGHADLQQSGGRLGRGTVRVSAARRLRGR